MNEAIDGTDAPARIAALEAENARLRAAATGSGSGPVVKLGPAQVQLVCPTSLGRRWHVVINLARAGREEPAGWGALGLCWPDFQRRHPYLGDIMAFGLRVADVLIAEGVPVEDLQAASVAACRLVQDGLAPVERAGDFSATRADGSAPGVGSNESSS